MGGYHKPKPPDPKPQTSRPQTLKPQTPNPTPKPRSIGGWGFTLQQFLMEMASRNSADLPAVMCCIAFIRVLIKEIRGNHTTLSPQSQFSIVCPLCKQKYVKVMKVPAFHSLSRFKYTILYAQCITTKNRLILIINDYIPCAKPLSRRLTKPLPCLPQTPRNPAYGCRAYEALRFRLRVYALKLRVLGLGLRKRDYLRNSYKDP